MPIFKKPKTLHWTHHAHTKMRYYQLSESRIKRVIHTPKRIEEGVAPKTMAMMQSAGSPKHPYELWVMIQDAGSKRKVISAWRYPGITKIHDDISAGFLKKEFGEFSETSDR